MPSLRALVLSTLLLQAATCMQFKIPIVENIVAVILATESSYVNFHGNATSVTSAVPTVHSSPDLAKRQSSYWYENIAHQGISAFGPAGYQVFRNVRDFGAKGDGVTDDTAAINAAVSAGGRCGQGCASTSTTPAVVYFPAGTYLISSSIVDYYYTQLIGDPTNLPVLKATAGFSGFGLIDGDKYFGPNLNWISTNVFLRQVRNFVLDVTGIPATSPATGIHWPTAQATSLQNIVFRMSAEPGTRHVGLFIESGSGGFMADLTFNGGLIGAQVGNQQFTMRGMTFNNCVTAISQLWSWGWVYQGLSINNCQKGIDVSAADPDTGNLFVGSVTVIDSSIANTPVGIVTAYSSTSKPSTAGSMILENVALTNVPVAIRSGSGATVLAGGTLTIPSWGQGHKYTPSGPVSFQGGFTALSRPSSLLKPGSSSYYTRSKPQYESQPVSAFVSARSSGATGNGVTDDTAALQAAINSATASGRILFLDAGTYVVTQTLLFPPGARIVGELLASVILAAGPFFGDMANPKPVVQVGARSSSNPGNIEWSDTIVSTRGPLPGAILIEWNLSAAEGTPSGMWDVHTRIGGFVGSSMQTAQCVKTPGSPAVKTQCIGAFMSMHIMPSASGLYMENNWLWVADHDIDDQSNTQINVYVGRGLYIESTAGRIWLSGTGVEHHTLYQYQLVNTRNIFMGFIQTETPYYQPNPIAPTPFTVNPALNDPDFGSSCSGQTGNCAEAWGLRIINSHDILVYGAGLYSFFNNYDTTCSNNPGPENCQNSILSLEGSLSNVEIYCLSTVGTTNMIVQNGVVLAKYSDNINVYPDTIALFQAAASAPSNNNWAALGCYTDNSYARTLANFVVVPGGQGATTIEACLSACHAAGYSFAGVEYSQECFCDNVLRNGGGPAPDGNAQCNMQCAGNSAETCGGPNRLSLYEYPLSVTNGWIPLGCYTDVVSARTLSFRVTSIVGSSMTIEVCLAACQAAGYSYAGVEYSQECYCDNALRNGGAPAPDGTAQCNMACAGNGGEICGGPNRLDMFQYSPWGFLGCFTDVVDARSLGLRVPTSTIPPASMTIEKCQGACRALGYSLAGVEYSQECFCDSTLHNSGIPAPDGAAQCNMACLGASSETCGGPNRLDLYAALSPSTSGKKWNTLGCYLDSIFSRTLAQMMTLPQGADKLTIEVCQALCYSAGYVYAGVEFSSECWCDSKIETNGPASDGSAGCNMACTGNAGEICGGANRINMYLYA